MACRLTIDLAPPLSPALLPPEVYAELYRSYVSTYRSIGFALLGRTNTPKSSPVSPQSPPRETSARPPRTPKPVPAQPQGDTTPRSAPRHMKEAPKAPPPASYAAAAAFPSPSSPSVKSAHRSVKVTAHAGATQPKPKSDTRLQPTPDLAVPSRAVSTPPPLGASATGDELLQEFDAEMSDQVDLVPLPPTPRKGKEPSAPGTFTVIEGGGGIIHKPWDAPLIVRCLDDPRIPPLLEKIENAAIPFLFGEVIDEKKLEFSISAEWDLLDLVGKLYEPMTAGIAQLFPSSARTRARLQNCAGLASPYMRTWRFPNGNIYWGFRKDGEAVYRLHQERGAC